MGEGSIERDRDLEDYVYGENTAGILFKFTRCFQFSLGPLPQDITHKCAGDKDNSQI